MKHIIFIVFLISYFALSCKSTSESSASGPTCKSLLDKSTKNCLVQYGNKGIWEQICFINSPSCKEFEKKFEKYNNVETKITKPSRCPKGYVGCCDTVASGVKGIAAFYNYKAEQKQRCLKTNGTWMEP